MKKSIQSALLALLGVAFISGAKAQWATYNTGDLVLSFVSNSGTQTSALVFDLGNVSTFINASSNLTFTLGTISAFSNANYVAGGAGFLTNTTNRWSAQAYFGGVAGANNAASQVVAAKGSATTTTPTGFSLTESTTNGAGLRESNLISVGNTTDPGLASFGTTINRTTFVGGTLHGGAASAPWGLTGASTAGATGGLAGSYLHLFNIIPTDSTTAPTGYTAGQSQYLGYFSLGTSGSNVVATFNAIPEPNSAVLFLAGALLLVCVVRRPSLI